MEQKFREPKLEQELYASDVPHPINQRGNYPSKCEFSVKLTAGQLNFRQAD